ncbi:MAG: hypothetical protein UHD64_06655 [Bacteroidales bacterium]|nr:hypothetical protein [Bacteroidales bacterium]
MKKNSLLCVKSIITIVVVITLCVLVIIDFLHGTTEYKDIFVFCISSVITFYFNHQQQKNKTGGNTNE